MENKIFQHAAHHRNGEGIQSGIDTTVVDRHVNFLRKAHREDAIGTLLACCAAGIWSRARKKEAGMILEDMCPPLWGRNPG